MMELLHDRDMQCMGPNSSCPKQLDTSACYMTEEEVSLAIAAGQLQIASIMQQDWKRMCYCESIAVCNALLVYDETL